LKDGFTGSSRIGVSERIRWYSGVGKKFKTFDVPLKEVRTVTSLVSLIQTVLDHLTPVSPAIASGSRIADVHDRSFERRRSRRFGGTRILYNPLFHNNLSFKKKCTSTSSLSSNASKSTFKYKEITSSEEGKSLTAQTAKRLVAVFEDMKATYETLLEFITEKQEIILDRDITALEELTEKEQSVVDQLEQLDRDRDTLLEELNPQSAPYDQVPLERILENVPEPVNERLRTLRNQLKRVVRDVQRINRENMILLENRVSVYDDLFEMITGDDKDGQTYGPDTQTRDQSTSPARLVDEAI